MKRALINVVIFFFVCGFFLLGTVSAISASLTNVNSSLARISISSASNLYAYEVNVSYSTAATAASSSMGFLGADTSFGSTKRNGYLYVYESKLDNTQTGVSGSGNLFNFSHSGTIELCGLLAVYANGTQESITYCDGGSSSPGTSGGSTGGSSGGGAGGGGGGGGVGASAVEAREFLGLSVETFIATLVLNQNGERTLTLRNTGNKTLVIVFSQEGLGESVTLPEPLVLTPGEEKTITLTFFTSEQQVLTGKLLFSVQDQVVKELPVILNVRTENFLLDSLISIPFRSRSVHPGEPLIAQFNLDHVGQSDEQVDVTATYTIKDFEGVSYQEESEDLKVEGSTEYIKEFDTEGLVPGKYALTLELTYPSAFATSSAEFEIAPPLSLSRILLFVALGVVMVVVVLILWWRAGRTKDFHHHAPRHKI